MGHKLLGRDMKSKWPGRAKETLANSQRFRLYAPVLTILAFDPSGFNRNLVSETPAETAAENTRDGVRSTAAEAD